jgi:hypothetical protein
VFPLSGDNEEETLMSRGRGRIQQTIIELIASDPHGAWTVGQICERIYPDEWRVQKKHRVAVTRGLRRMELPSTWGVCMLQRRGAEYCLYDKCDEESTLRVDYLGWWKVAPIGFWSWREKWPHRIEAAAKSVEKARRYRDASPIGKLDIEIADAREWDIQLSMLEGSPAAKAANRQKIAELKEKKAELEREAAGADVQ